MYQREIKLDDCPVCGATESAHKGSSLWGHNLMCCSDECGVKAGEIIRKNESSDKYRRKKKKYYKIQGELYSMRLKGLKTDHEPFFSI